MSLLVEDLVRLTDYYDIERTAVLGLSLGGVIGLGLAIDYPERVDRLICCGVRASIEPALAEIWDARIAAVRRPRGIAEEVASSLERWFTRVCHKTRPDIVQEAADMLLQTRPEGRLHRRWFGSWPR
jgi:3-oxoadipate enol-lactonase